jgi:hypothetical protein
MYIFYWSIAYATSSKKERKKMLFQKTKDKDSFVRLIRKYTPKFPKPLMREFTKYWAIRKKREKYRAKY